ncbi:MAG: hypothetical protein ACP5JJ_19215 [Anaerolineae bacterium]
MAKQGPRKRRLPECHCGVDLEMALRQSPPGCNAALLSWLRRWCRRPERVFWLVEGDGQCRRLP